MEVPGIVYLVWTSVRRLISLNRFLNMFMHILFLGGKKRNTNFVMWLGDMDSCAFESLSFSSRPVG